MVHGRVGHKPHLLRLSSYAEQCGSLAKLPREVETPAPALNMTGLMNTLKPRGQ